MITSKSYSQLSKTISHALRHEPWLYELELDSDGWVDIDLLISSLAKENEAWFSLTKSDLQEMISSSEKQRHEIVDNKIRALYGHSEANSLKKSPSEPPEYLYHGTIPTVVDEIMRNGLLPMSRQYVHLSVDIATAKEVGKRKDKKPQLLKVAALDASNNDVKFYKGNEKVWLADSVPGKYIELV